MKHVLILLLLLCSQASAIQGLFISEFTYEYGFLGVISHIAQFSEDGTEIDYRDEGAQDILFPFSRIQVAVSTHPHRFFLLYQPLEITTVENAQRDLLIDEEVFEENTPIRFKYSFPFYRAGYTYSFTDPFSRFQFAAGGALQIRNANISFTSLDGNQLRTNRDVGLVPLLRIISSWRINPDWLLQTEIDGIYAPVRYLNLSDTDVEGAFIDANLRAIYAGAGFVSVYSNIRYLAGGAEGTSDPNGPGDGFVRNWLQFLTLSLGLSLSI
ncbi:hypothetical protein QA601_06055 [Chitinispirillales bacterium ANBcel5]|uniref:hypothetical protein n=1 Tax=Cellulosispirillum alkaliphilum TaxID=3039283 RepID=UPI002A51F799|nr:hypothetical protein [Chitinispirillales bacterium ANBcel5]